MTPSEATGVLAAVAGGVTAGRVPLDLVVAHGAAGIQAAWHATTSTATLLWLLAEVDAAEFAAARAALWRELVPLWTLTPVHRGRLGSVTAAMTDPTATPADLAALRATFYGVWDQPRGLDHYERNQHASCVAMVLFDEASRTGVGLDWDSQRIYLDAQIALLRAPPIGPDRVRSAAACPALAACIAAARCREATGG